MTQTKYAPPSLFRLSDTDRFVLLSEIASILFSAGEVTNEHWHPDGWSNRVRSSIDDYEESDAADETIKEIVGAFRRFGAVPAPVVRTTTVAPFAALINPELLVKACKDHGRNHPLGVWPYGKVERLCYVLGVPIERDGSAPEYVDFGGFDD